MFAKTATCLLSIVYTPEVLNIVCVCVRACVCVCACVRVCNSIVTACMCFLII